MKRTSLYKQNPGSLVLKLKAGWAAALIYVFIDILCIGMGMGLPIFCIFLGLPVGGYLALKLTSRYPGSLKILAKILQWAALTSGLTFVLMLVIWGSSVVKLFDPTFNVEDYGIPMILFEPLASFIGWMMLMIVVSPALQFLMTLFGAHLGWLWVLSRREESPVFQIGDS